MARRRGAALQTQRERVRARARARTSGVATSNECGLPDFSSALLTVRQSFRSMTPCGSSCGRARSARGASAGRSGGAVRGAGGHQRACEMEAGCAFGASFARAHRRVFGKVELVADEAEVAAAPVLQPCAALREEALKLGLDARQLQLRGLARHGAARWRAGTPLCAAGDTAGARPLDRGRRRGGRRPRNAPHRAARRHRDPRPSRSERLSGARR